MHVGGVRGWVTALVVLGHAVSAFGGGDVGTVAGRVTRVGPPPVRPPLPVSKSKEVCGNGVIDERLVVGPGGGLRYAIVTVDGVEGGKKPEPDLTVVLDNHDCRFQPHVQVAEVGQWLAIENSDPILHAAFARLGQETLFNAALPPNRHVRKPLGRPGMMRVTCDVHTWMSAWIDVTDHPYHAVTDIYGAYEIRDLPPGSYTLRIWHEELGTLQRPVTIEGGKTTTVDVAYPASAAKQDPKEEDAR
jgi:Carboxypeptidase regulatory-like domain